MQRRTSKQTAASGQACPGEGYSHLRLVINNLPYTAMTVLGAAVLLIGLRTTPWACAAAGLYVFYAAAGALWIIVFLCPYCHCYDTEFCPCGYGKIAAMLRPQKESDCFKEQFRKHIPVIVPLWFIPVLAGAVFLVSAFSWPMLALVLVFALDSFVVLPLVSRRYGCGHCPQRDTCPWIGPKADDDA